MRVVILYRNDSDKYPAVRTFLGDFARQYPDRKIEGIDPDSGEGVKIAESYGLMEFPAVMVLTDTGNVVKQWNGSLPSMSEVAYFAG